MSWSGSVKNEEVLHRVNKERNTLHTIKRRLAKWMGHVLRKKCLENTLLMERYRGWSDEKEDVSSY